VGRFLFSFRCLRLSLFSLFRLLAILQAVQEIGAKMKKQSLKNLKAKAWTVFSAYIRQRDQGICYTCGDRRNWKEQQAGHFIHGKKYPVSYFDESNVHCQCVRCNHFLSGNLARYATRLVAQYGPAILEEIQAEKNIIKVGRDFYEGIILRYSEKTK